MNELASFCHNPKVHFLKDVRFMIHNAIHLSPCYNTSSLKQC